MKILLELSDDQSAVLMKESVRLGISAEELVKAEFNDWMNRSHDDFQQAADYVLSKNTELYQRLSK